MAWTGKRTLTLVGLGAGVLVLYLLGAEKQNEGAGGDNPPQCRVAVTADGVNIRSAPVPDRSAINGSASAGDEFDAEKTVQNGFRKLTDGRWLSTQYIRPLEGRDCG